MLAQSDIAHLLAAIAPYFAGPASAVIVLMTVLFGLYKLSITQLIPLANRALDAHLARIDALIAVQREESKQVTKTLSSIDRRLARLEGQSVESAYNAAMSPDRLT